MRDAIISFPIFGESFSLNPSSYFLLFGRPVYWYGVIIALGFLLAVVYILRRRDDFGLTQDNVLDMLIISVPAGIVCARLFYVIFYFSEYEGHLIDAVKIWKGGLAIYGGIIGAVIGIIIYSRAKKIPLGTMLDAGALGLLIGQAVGRWGNFLNREAYGYTTDLPWKMGLTYSDGTTIYVHPTFLYESLWNILGFILLHIFSKKHRKYDGQIFIMYLAWYGLGRFIIEGLRSDSLYLFQTGIRVSQLLAALSFAVAVILLIRNRANPELKPENLYVSRIKQTDGDVRADGSKEDVEGPQLPDNVETADENPKHGETMGTDRDDNQNKEA